jgi:hypothetical protein
MTCNGTCTQPTPSQAHCGACHTTFGGVSGFDRHRRDGQCLTPAEIGYTDDGRGVYRAPITNAARERFAALRGNAPSARLLAPQTAETRPVVGQDTPDPSGWNWQPTPDGGWYSGPDTL